LNTRIARQHGSKLKQDWLSDPKKKQELGAIEKKPCPKVCFCRSFCILSEYKLKQYAKKLFRICAAKHE